MDELLFVVGLGVGLLGIVTWGWKTLPDGRCFRPVDLVFTVQEECYQLCVEVP